MDKKCCKKCGKLKILEEFVKCKRMKDGYRNECRDCMNIEQKKKWTENKTSRENEKIKTEGKKICRLCNDEKDIKDFHLKRGTPDGRRSECKECIKTYLKKWDDNTPEGKQKRAEYDNKYYKDNLSKILEMKKEHYQENRERLLSYKEEYRKTDSFKENDKIWRNNNKERLATLQSNYRKKYPHIIAWRSVLYSTLKRLGTPKEGHTIDMLGYSALDLKHHIGNQFVEGMTWENHGEWHIDHITAVVNFPQDASIKEVCALDNLQPLWEFDNLSKNKY